MWALNHDADSAVQTFLTSNGTTITVTVVRSSTANLGTGPFDTVGTVSYPVTSGNQNQDDTVCTVNQPGTGCLAFLSGQTNGRQDNFRLAYAPQGDAILLAIDEDTIFTTFGTPYSCSITGGIIITGLSCVDATNHTASYQVQLHRWSLPSKTHSTITAPSGQDVWWWGISEDDSSIVAGLGQRDERYLVPALGANSTPADSGTGCTVQWRPPSFGSSLQSVSTPDACRMMATAQEYGGGSVAAGHLHRLRSVLVPRKPAIHPSRFESTANGAVSWWTKLTSP
jgi:hypothetical protein